MTTVTPALPRLRLMMPDLRHWPAASMLATAAILYALAGFSLAADGTPGEGLSSAGLQPGRPAAIPPAPEPLLLRPVAPRDAQAINAAVPVSEGPNPAARGFLARYAGADDRARALHCLTAAVYYEAAIEPLDGQRAVAQVVLNRVRHPAYPNSVCGVVFQGSERQTGCQFTFTCDGSLRRTPSAPGWARARAVAEAALAGNVFKQVGWATHYHTNWVVPYWSASLVKAANIGTHIFYRWAGGWGRPGAFGRAAASVDPGPAAIRAAEAALAADSGAVDAAAALAASLAANPDSASSASVDSFQRAVLRRYEPLSREVATEKAIARTGEPASPSLRWALGGERPAGASPALGRVAEKAEQPRCLEGVRRLPEKVQGPPETQAC